MCSDRTPTSQEACLQAAGSSPLGKPPAGRRRSPTSLHEHFPIKRGRTAAVTAAKRPAPAPAAATKAPAEALSVEAGALLWPDLIDVPKADAAAEARLREWDLDVAYGPCIGISRAQRYYRALAIGLNPPEEILLLLKKPAARSGVATRAERAADRTVSDRSYLEQQLPAAATEPYVRPVTAE